jgi:hypothetical protein
MAYSPPYLNHIDYTEVYKTELWLLGFVRKQDEMLGLRQSTMRSHSSVIFPGQDDEDQTLARIPADVTEAVAVTASIVEGSGSRWHLRFRTTALGYIVDLQRSLQRQFDILAPGGSIVCVIGNASHGRSGHVATVAADLWYARMAEAVGFRVRDIVVGRTLRRRGADCTYLRESVVLLDKPIGA